MSIDGYNINEEQISAEMKKYEKKAEEYLKDSKKINKLIEKAKELCERLSNLPIIGEYFHYIPVFCSLISDYKNHKYKAIPLASIITVTAAVIYVVSPIDLIPDVLPLAGQIDDVAVILITLEAVKNDLSSYETWREENSSHTV